MFSNLVDELRSFTLKYFPKRQVYLRSGGEVSYFVLTTRLQVMAVAIFLAITSWCLLTMLNLLWGNNPLRGPDQLSKIREAEYERILQDTQAKYDAARQQLTLQQESFEKAARTFQEKHATIARLVNQPVLDSGTTVFTDMKYSEGQILNAPTIRDTMARTKRNEYIQTASLDSSLNSNLDMNNPMAKLDVTQNEILLSAEDATIDNIERSRAIIETTDMSVKQVLSAGDNARGGPLLEIGDIGNPNSGRIQSIKARAYEAKLLNDAVTAMPLGFPVNAETYMTSRFGVRKDPFTKRPAMHQAIDIAAYKNSPIIATADGTVKFAGRKRGYGWVIDIDHGHGFVTRYAHLAKLKVKRGQKVEIGDTIALMGSSGRSTSTHLHYEIRFHDKVYDPEKFIKAGRYVQ